ncbi:carbon-nitrogen hydrolase family protein [Sphingobium boeckii]|uniref:Putative amidohydrolase n=1 Tax=Sphingobium boeckii TaxID=1082345 RepID=A0A7W9EES8_9SPHN|nr:carbon-nitrogen hydrolase family protein [Sphingobium boeckii]MBB5685340.1 putative amidohydrolase [Sphingobium boeckii]
MIRVATAQMETGKDTDRVLRQILELIDEAAQGGADLVHFQENLNYPTSYDNREHAWNEAITIPGPMVNAISERAAAHGIHVSFNAAVRGEFPNAYMVNHLIGPKGEYIGSNAKQILMWIERLAFVPADAPNAVYDTALGRIGLLSCMDGLIPETARTLALQGADIILNSLCSNGLDEAHLHIPARAAENGVFMIAANRIGDMVKGADLERLIRESGMTREKVMGAGESQIVGPQGEVLARAGRDTYGLTFADIDLASVVRDTRLAGRRPECYALLTQPNETLTALTAGRADAGTVTVTTVSPAGADFETRLASAIAELGTVPAGFAVLPELFAWDIATLVAGSALQAQIQQAIAAIESLAAERATYIAAGIPEIVEGRLVNRVVLIGPDGAIGQYRQVHADPALGWGLSGDDFPIFDLPFGRVGLLLGSELIYPEAARMLARKGVDLVACPATWRDEWQVALMLAERSAENHMTIAAANRADSPFDAPSAILTTPPVYRFPDTMEVNNPDRFDAAGRGATLSAEIDLAPNRDKRLMGSTDLILDSQPQLYGRLVEAKAAA